MAADSTLPAALRVDLLALTDSVQAGQARPQPQQAPSQALALTADMEQAALVQAGRELFYGKGTCALCHTIGERGVRCPDLEGIGSRAETRIKEARYQGKATTGAEYLAESLYEPFLYVVEGYPPSMPPLGRQFNDLAVVALVAFMQSLGGTVTVDGRTRFPQYRTEGMDSMPAVQSGEQSGAELVKTWQCDACHKFDGPGTVLGPSLWDIGARASATAIREAILQPDARTMAGYPAGVMKAILQGMGFYQKVTLHELNTLVDYLTSRKGDTKTNSGAKP
jgi:cytochrome c2